jgi:hypothetical protein
MKTDFDKGSVILHHGLRRSKSAMKTVRTYLKACGYTVWNGGYAIESAALFTSFAS